MSSDGAGPPAPPPLPWDVRTGDESETVALGARLAGLLRGGDVVRLHGELGAGKTSLVRGIAGRLGAGPSDVHSPSFSLVHLYRDRSRHPVLYHVDLYRVAGQPDLREIGLEDVLGGDVPAAVEWAERLEGSQFGPEPGDLDVRLEITSRSERRIQVRRISTRS